MRHMRRALLEENSDDPQAVDQRGVRRRRREKFTGKVAPNWDRWGYSRQFMYATGIAELVALTLFWWPGLELIGAGGLGLVLLGAIGTQIRHREGPSHVALAAVTLFLVAVHVVRVNGRIGHDHETHCRHHGPRSFPRRRLVRRRHLVGAPVRRGARERARRNGLYLPMHPDYRSEHPGNCPICGMSLKPEREGAQRTARPAPALPHGAVQVNPDRQQAIGVRLGIVERLAATRVLRTSGRVGPDENRTYPIVAAVSGWVRSVENVTTGDAVKKDQVLASFLAPELEFRNAQQSYYTGLEAFYRLVATQRNRNYSRRRSSSRTPPRAAPDDRAHGGRAADDGRIQLAAQRDGQAPRGRA